MLSHENRSRRNRALKSGTNVGSFEVLCANQSRLDGRTCACMRILRASKVETSWILGKDDAAEQPLYFVYSVNKDS